MTRLPETEVVRVERHGPVVIATIDDPSNRNAMSDALLTDLLAILSATQEDRSLKALVLRGANGHFCAGAQLKADALSADRKAVAELSKRGAQIYHTLNAHPLTVVAVVDGPALGGGFGLACCADVVLCGPRARFALSETRLGLVPAQIAPFVVARLGLRTTRRLALTGVSLNAEEALAIGLADQVAATETELARHLSTVLSNIGQCAPGANAATKALLLSLDERGAGQIIERAAHCFADAVCGPEGCEGIQAFREKRKPRWVEGH